MEIRKNVIILQAWDSDEGHRTSKKLIQELDKGIYTDLIIVSPQEYEVNWKEHINASAKELEAALVKNNVMCTIIYGSYDKVLLHPHQDPVLNTSIIYMPLFFAYSVANETQSEYGLYRDIPELPIEKVAISLSNKPHEHRCHAMEALGKNRILPHMHYSWIETSDQYQEKYPFHSFDDKVKYISDDFRGKLCSSITPGVEVLKSAFEIVLESTNKGSFFTEKTFNAIARERPFLIISRPGENELLEQFGFKSIIDELGLTHVEESWEHLFRDTQETKDNKGYIFEIIHQLSLKLEHYYQDPTRLYSELKPIAEFNRKRLKHIYENKLYFPIALTHLLQRTKLTLKDLNVAHIFEQQ